MSSLSLSSVPVRFSHHFSLNDCTTILRPITGYKNRGVSRYKDKQRKSKKKNMEIIKWDQVMGILSNSNKRKPDFESLKSLIPRLL